VGKSVSFNHREIKCLKPEKPSVAQAARLLRRRSASHRHRPHRLEAFGPPIYVRKEIVHNRFVVEELQGKAPFLLTRWMKFLPASA